MRYAEDRVAAIKVETDKLTGLLESNTELTREDKELTEQWPISRARSKLC